MNSLQIQLALRHINASTVGVFPADKIPIILERPCAIVANTDDSKKPGAHWVAMYVDSEGRGTFFDSYGLPPMVPQHIDRLRRNCTVYEWNIQQLQSINSIVCGEYCIDFLFYMSRGFELNMFCSLFSNDSRKNDSLSKKLFNKITKKKRKKISKHKTICKYNNFEQSCKPRRR